MAADFVARARATSPDGFDLAVATPPCTAFSMAGDREGTESEQGFLAIRTVDIINELGVPFALIENVPGLLSARHGADFGKFLGRLIGADADLVHPGGTWPAAGCAVGPLHHVTWRVLDAQYFGTPQRRRRVFIFAAPDASAFSIFN